MSQPSPPPKLTLHGLLHQRAERDPGHVGYRFAKRNNEAEELTIGELDRRARAIGRNLIQRGAAGQRALLVHGTEPGFIAAFFGCLYAGAVPVSGFLPEPVRLTKSLERLAQVVEDSEPMFALSTHAAVEQLPVWVDRNQTLAKMTWIETDELAADSDSSIELDVSTGGLAYLQYTSGSTGLAKGVMLGHEQYLANLEMQRQLVPVGPESRIVTWLPLFHDMGFVGPILHPVFVGCQTTFVPPALFMLRPMRWLAEMSRAGGTIGAGPNFAFDLCIQKSTEEERAELDLSSWSSAMNGAEPIRPETLDRFHDAFASAGLSRQALFPAFGLAEAVCMVTGAPVGSRPTVVSFDRRGIERGIAEEVSPGPDAQEIVSCGVTTPDHEVVIVADDGARVAGPDEVGEIFVRGPSVALGYWGRPEETQETFEARVPGRSENFLRTGDLGFIHKDELYVSGRLKDLIIIRGRNYAAHDVERTAASAHPMLETSCAAFPIEEEGQERLVVVQEARSNIGEEAAEAVAAIRRAVMRDHGIHCHAVVLVEVSRVPRTPSGKIRRKTCRAAYMDDALEHVIYASKADDGQPALRGG